MIDPLKCLPVTRQCELLELNRSTLYYLASAVSSEELALMRRIDEMHLERPFYGSRRIRDWLQDEDHDVNRKRVQRLMRLMGIMAVYPKPRTSRPENGHKIYPYLLRGMTVHRPNQVWATDIVSFPKRRTVRGLALSGRISPGSAHEHRIRTTFR